MARSPDAAGSSGSRGVSLGAEPGSGRDAPLLRGISARFLFSLAVLVGLGLTQHFVLRHQLDTDREMVAVINVAGRQRMLTQRAALISHRLIETPEPSERTLICDELRGIAEQIEEAHGLLTRAESPRAEGRDLPQAVAALYFSGPSHLDARIQEFVASTHRFADLPPAEQSAEHPDFQRIDRGASSELLASLEEVVRGYQRDAEARLRDLGRFQATLWTGEIALLLVIWLFSFRPLLIRLRAYLARLADMNDTLEDRVREGTATATRRADELAASERQLRDQTRLLQAIMSSMNESLLAVDNDDRILLANPAARQLFGEPGAKTLSEWIAHCEPLLPDGKTAWPREDLPIVRTLRARQPAEASKILMRKPGSKDLLYLGMACHPLDDDAGHAIGALCVVRDITQQTLAEQQLRQAQKMEAVGQLTGGLAHDFNNLLTVVLGNLELLQEHLAEGTELRSFLDEAMDASQHGAELTRRLLAFSRQQALAPRLVDLNKLILDMTGMLRRTLGESVALETVTAAGLWETEIDPHGLETTLLNLALNARDAMPEGGRLTIETGNVRVDDDYASRHAEVNPGQYVMIAVTDTGCGIPAEMRERIFEPFFTTKEAGKGSGLGLSMAFGYVKQSGGHIKAYSEAGQGTTLKLYLPRAQAGARESEHAEAERDSIPDPRGHETVLVIEDDVAVRRLALRHLEELGYRTLEAGSGDEALALLRENPRVDLLFTDVILPGGSNGRKVAQAISELRPGIKVLYTSGYTENAIVHHGRLDAGIQLLPKPYGRRELARKIRSVLDSGGRSH